MVIFDINGAVVEFDEKVYNYNAVRKKFKKHALEARNEFEEYCLNNILTLNQLSDKCLEMGFECIEGALRIGVETIVSYGVITIDIDTFKNYYCKEYLNYERLFYNFKREFTTSSKGKKNNNGNYNNRHSLKPLINKLSQYIYDDCFDIHFAVIDALVENGVRSVSSYISEENKKRANALFNNYKDGFISARDENKVIEQIITLNPYRIDVYEFLIKEEGDFSREIEDLTEFLGYDIKDYKDELMTIYIKRLIADGINDIEMAEERVSKYCKYIGCEDDRIYLTRLDAIRTFESA